MLKDKVYIGGGIASSAKNEQTVVVYDPKQDSCDTLPPYMYRYFTMVVVDGHLVLVGGRKSLSYKTTNKLGVWNERSKKWTHPLPPMTTARCSTSVTIHNRWLVVMGGTGDAESDLSMVEILDTAESDSQNIQWHQAASLPHPCHQVSSATVGNVHYLVGGFVDGDKSRKVLSVCLDDLISQAVFQSTGVRVSSSTPSPWQLLIPDTPLAHSTALGFNGALLVVGGGSSGSSAIYAYQPSSNSWIKAGELPIKRCDSGNVLYNGEVLVAGGGGFDDETSQTVEIASII